MHAAMIDLQCGPLPWALQAAARGLQKLAIPPIFEMGRTSWDSTIAIDLRMTGVRNIFNMCDK
jgi:hypothetical protein